MVVEVYLLAGWWQFVGLGCQRGEILQDGLQVRHLTKHVDLVVLSSTWGTINIWTASISGGAHAHTHTRTDQHRLQHCDKGAVSRSLLYECPAHGPLLRLLQDGVAHVDVLQRAVQLAAHCVLP